jgi:hypothetical protein
MSLEDQSQMPQFSGRKRHESDLGESTHSERAYQPTPRECAMLLLRLIEAKHTETGKDVTRTRLSEATLRKLWCRSRITTEFVHEVQEWLFMAGWVLFFAGSTYAMINLRVVDAWMRISAKRMAKEIAEVQRGKKDIFAKFEHLLLRNEEGPDDDSEETE